MDNSGSGRSLALEIDLNEDPLPSPREFISGGGGAGTEQRCGSCGEVAGVMVVCGDCGRRFHVECLGVKKVQRIWKCFDCLSDGRTGKRFRRASGAGGSSRGSGLFDMNASPPREVDCGKEGFFVNSELVLAASFPKMQDLRRNPFLGFTLSSPMAHLTGGFPSQNPACSMTRFAQINLETVTQKGNLVYLQALKDYISEKRGVLGDGWRVQFEFSENTCKTSAVYIAPDEKRFDSMSQVADYLGLISFETEDKSSGIILLQKGSHSSKRTKDRKLKVHKNMLLNGGNAKEVDSIANGSKFCDDFPVQFEDFFVISVGKIDQRDSFHNSCQIWPVGYRSIWHDKFTGSIFLYSVLENNDGSDSGPIFGVHRYPCTTHSIPYATKVLCITKCKPILDEDDNDTSIHTLFTEHTPPPHLNESCLTAETDVNLHKAQSKNDFIGEFSVEEKTASSAWKKAVGMLLHLCHEVFNSKKGLNFCCNHRVNENGELNDFDSLGKFSFLAGPVNSILDKISSVDEFEASCEVLRKWLEHDRFGLDAEFVQELIEQLPGVNSCSQYKSLNERSRSLISQTVESGFFTVISKDCLQNEAVSDGLMITNKRPSPPGNAVTSNLPPHLIGDVIQSFEVCLRFYEVFGLDAPVSRQVLENELMNPWVDDLNSVKQSLNDFQKSVNLNTCGNDSVDTSAEHEEDGPRVEAASKCAGVELAKIHMALLKVLIEDVLAKVKEIFDPFGSMESKSRKGKKKDVEVGISSMKINLDLLPVNEFTWPEIARRFILVALSVDGNVDSSEVMSHECGKVFHCLYGDGGTLCGSLTGVAAMEADAMVLTDASKNIYSSVNCKFVEFLIDPKEVDTGDSVKETTIIDDDFPEWAQSLEPVRKLPTNVGARIRRCIHDSLTKNPPEWAKQMLEHSISKEVYKGNASGPTKRAVITVLEKVRVENPQQKPIEKKPEKEKSAVKTLSDAVMKRCRVVLRTVAASDEDRVFFNLLAKTFLKPNDPDDTGILGYPGMVSRPLDFRTVDLRLAAGFYATSHESFIEDIREVWENLRIAYRDMPDYIELVETLSKKFEDLYEEMVLNLVNRITEAGNSLDSSAEEEKKELNSLVNEIIEGPLPPAPWEDGVCKVCGMDRNDDSVLLCDKCDSEYHTFCLEPPLARIPAGNWYCPSCMSCQPVYQDERCGTRALSRLRGKRKFQKEFTRNLLEKLAPLADTMEIMQYWELGIEERVFLFKFLCDEALSSGVVRSHLGPDSDSSDLEKNLRKLYKELKNQNKKEELLSSNLSKEIEDKSQEEILSFPKSSESQSQVQNEENDEHKQAGQEQESLSEVKNKISSLQEKIATLESKIAKPVIRREYLGRDSVGRLYWILSNPDRVVVSGPHSRRKSGPVSSSLLSRLNECEMTEMSLSDDSSWTCYEADTEIQDLLSWLNDDDAREKDLKETIKHWQINRGNDVNTPQVVQGNYSTSFGYITKARTVLEKKYGSFLKNNGGTGKTVSTLNWHRCECLEMVGSARHHCSSCHLTFLTNEELGSHNNGKCENRQETENPSKSKKIVLLKQPTLTTINDCHNEPGSPFVFEEIRARFCPRGSLKEEVKNIGLIGSNGIPSFVYGSTDSQQSEKLGVNETPSKVEKLKPKNIGGKSSLKNRTPVRICQSSLKPLTGRVLEILRCIKINLFDIETALPEDAFRPSRSGLDRMRAWRSFVKSAQSIFEMVQATIILEDMIKTKYFKKEWWFWSSPATAAKISNISALALRIYALDAAVCYEKPTAAILNPTEPVTPKPSRSEKKTPEKSNAKDSSEKSNTKNRQRSSSPPVTESKPVIESSRPKTRSKKRMRDSDS